MEQWCEQLMVGQSPSGQLVECSRERDGGRARLQRLGWQIECVESRRL